MDVVVGYLGVVRTVGGFEETVGVFGDDVGGEKLVGLVSEGGEFLHSFTLARLVMRL